MIFLHGWKEITPHEYAVRLTKQTPVHPEHRQMHDESDPHCHRAPLVGFLLIFNDFTGVAVTSDLQIVGSDYEYVTQFWAFGCDHHYKEVPWDSRFGYESRLMRLHRCEKCGKEQSVSAS